MQVMVIFMARYFYAIAFQSLFLYLCHNYLGQWFSDGRDFGPRGHLAMSRDTLCCHNWGSATVL